MLMWIYQAIQEESSWQTEKTAYVPELPLQAEKAACAPEWTSNSRQ